MVYRQLKGVIMLFSWVFPIVFSTIQLRNKTVYSKHNLVMVLYFIYFYIFHSIFNFIFYLFFYFKVTFWLHCLFQDIFHHVLYTECNRRNVRDFGRVFLRSNYTDITQNTYIQSWTVTEIMAGEFWNMWQLLLTHWLPNTYWNWQEYVVSVMLIAVRNIKLTCE